MAVYVVSMVIFCRFQSLSVRFPYPFANDSQSVILVFHALYNNLHALARMNNLTLISPTPFSLNEKCSSHKKWAEKRSLALPALSKIDIILNPIELSS